MPGTTRRTPCRNAGLERQRGDVQRGPGRGVGRLEDQAIARRQGRADLPRRHRERVVPRQDRGDDAEGLALGEGEHVGAGRGDGAVELVGGLREVADGLDRAGDVALEGLGDGLASVLGVEAREKLEVALHEVGEAQQRGGALARSEAGPDAGREDARGVGRVLGDLSRRS